MSLDCTLNDMKGCSIYRGANNDRICVTELADFEPKGNWDDAVYVGTVDTKNYLETVGDLLEFDTRRDEREFE